MPLHAQVECLARQRVPQLPAELEWEFLPSGHKGWWKAYFQLSGRPASLELEVITHPTPSGRWRINYETRTIWPDTISEGDLTSLLPG